MDLRTIINSESTTGSRQPPSLSPRRSSGHGQGPYQGGHPQQHNEGSESYPGQPEPRSRPPQPPPLQPPHHPSPGGSTSYGSAQSPYQQNTSASTLSGGGGPHAPRSQTFPHAVQNLPPTATTTSNNNNATSYSQSVAGSSSSPFSPQPMAAGTPQSYFSQPRSHSSIHSATTPTSSRSFSYPLAPPPPLHRDSSANSQQQAILSQPQFYSPNQSQQPQPGTPLARPSSSYPHPSPSSGRPVSSGRDAQQQLGSLGSPSADQDVRKHDQGAVAMSPAPTPSLSRHNSSATHYFQGALPSDQNRGSTMSVSPKTAAANMGNQDDINRSGRFTSEQPGHQAHRADGGETNWQANNNAAADSASQPHDMALPVQQSSRPPTTPKNALPSAITPRNSTVSPHSNRPSIADMSPAPMSSRVPGSDRSTIPSESTPARPKKRRKRYNEPPIFAQKAPRTAGAPPEIPASRQSAAAPSFLPRKPTPRKPDRLEDQTPSKSRSSTPRHVQPVKDDTNGPAVNGAVPGHVQERKQSLLGPWEPSITGVIPHEELTKVICDFLFQQVVMRKDIGAGPAGAAAAGAGAILEVEAKLGQLVDKNRGERVRLPVLTESVLSKEDPGLRIAFESSMSLTQHRALNNFLNEAVKATMAPGAKRMPLSYAHKKEQDSFFEIAPKALPPVVQHHLNPRHKPKVRVTTDQRTGAVLARIVKCRIADLDVYSPRTCLDWRISVNLEMNYDGDLNELVPTSEVGPTGRPRGDRNKDRMSYRHLAYQIDLTQVAGQDSTPGNPQTDFEHELEVEISSAEVRRQGDLALAGDPDNQYEELVKGFVDNVRVLARAVPDR